jgi:membrane protease YdiL (CAAX protease family)
MDTPSPDRTFLARIFISPAEPRLRAGWRVLVQYLLLQALTILFALLLGWLFFLALGETGLLLVSQAVSLPAWTAAVWIARRYLDRRSFLSLGLAWDRQAALDLRAGFLIPGLLFTGLFLFERLAGWLQVSGYAWQERPALELAAGILLMFLVFAVVAWNEELLCRGYQLQNLVEGAGLLWGVLLSSAIFAALHYANPAFDQNLLPFLGLFAGGLFFAYAYLRTRRLWLPIGLHLGWNFFEGPVFGFPVSGLTNLPVLVRQVDEGPVLVTGGAFGPEAGLIIFPVLALGALLVYLYTRQ